MDYGKLASQLLPLVGGEENITSVAHCATRLRFVLKDDAKAQTKKIMALDGVKGAFSSAGQYQVIIGQGAVNDAYDALIKITNIKESSVEDQKAVAAQKLNIVQRFCRMLSGIFVPIIPAIVACGLLMGLLNTLTSFKVISSTSGLYQLLNMFSNAAFVFLPMIIAFSAAKTFKTNPFLAAVIGAIMIHPSLLNAWNLGLQKAATLDIFGLHVAMVGYQGTVIPVLLAVWVMSKIEHFVHKIIPNVLDILLTPFITVLVTAFVTIVFIGPVGRLIGDGISFGLKDMYLAAGPIAGLVFGGLYSTIVITGIHHSFHAIEAGLLANPSIHVNFLLPIWAMANVAQGGAALAVYFRTSNKKVKALAAPSSLSCFLGITEPAIFGVNLRYGRPFIGGAIGGAAGGLFMGLMKVGMQGLGVTGIPGIAITSGWNMINYIIGMGIAVGVAFVVTLVIYQDKDLDADEETAPAPAPAVKSAV